MLGSKKSTISVSGKTTLVSSDTVILGEIRFSGVLDIEGLVRGNIIAEPGKEALVRVVDKGRVEGEIRAPSVVINGTVQGDVYATRHLELAAKARVQGNVFYVRRSMAALRIWPTLKKPGQGTRRPQATRPGTLQSSRSSLLNLTKILSLLIMRGDGAPG
jgi:cytoskeletal protein CcmA (bactofilin family)